MNMRKSTVIESINKLPDEFSIDEIIERLIIIEKIEKGLKEVKDGKINTEDQAKAKLSKWLN
jgi:predicted transcriptional regulator